MSGDPTSPSDTRSPDVSGQGTSMFSFADDSPNSQSSPQSRTSKRTFSFMEKRQTFEVRLDGVVVTPDDIIDPDYITMEDTFTHAAFESKSRFKSEIGLRTSKSRTMSRSTTDAGGVRVYATTINLDDIHIDHTLNTEEGYAPEATDLEVAPSAFYLPKLYPVMAYPPKIYVQLKETDTQYLFEMPSTSYDKGTAEGTRIEEENEYYLYITVGKGRNRKMVVEETQTKECVTQTRHTLATRPQKKNASSFASLWDMYDTYAKLALVEEEEEPDEMVLYQSAAAHLLRKRKKALTKRAKTFEEIAATPEFMDAVIIVERVIASQKFSDAQKKFRGLVSMNPLSLDLVYIYSLDRMWTLECEETAGKPITSISFNPKNENILAVGHGKFCYAENAKGYVCIWCTKNPCKPERLYRFEVPVTSVSFSEKNPNTLACGFANGDVIILDITSHAIRTKARSKRETNPCFDPIWVTNWRTIDRDTEYVMTACQDGRINRFISTKTHDFICSPMMRITTVEGKLKGMETTKTCMKVDVPITRYPAALCTKWHPTNEHVYLVGTDEGCVHKCSTHYLNQHIDVFRAHSGPVYAMEISPFMNSLLLTCGADNAIRLWIEGIDDMIMTLNCPSAVYGAAFCPINSTVLISVSGNVLSVWDLRRKTHLPCAEYTFANNVVLTYVKFSSSGDNVFVGDTSGMVHTFHLEDTPIPPYYQRELLDDTLKKALCTRPQLLRQIEKLEKFRLKHSK